MKSHIKYFLVHAVFTFAGTVAAAQGETDILSPARDQGLELTYTFVPGDQVEPNSKGQMVKSWKFTFRLRNRSENDVNITRAFVVKWSNVEVEPPGGKSQDSELRLPTGKLARNGAPFTEEVTIYTPDRTFSGQLTSELRLRVSDGVWTVLKETNTRRDTYEEHKRRAQEYEADGNYTDAKAEWAMALEKKPGDPLAKAKVGEMEGQIKGQNYDNYVKSNIADQKARNAQDQKNTEDFITMMADMAGILYGDVGTDKGSQNMFSKGSTRFTFTSGYSFAMVPTYSNEVYEFYSGSTYTYTYSTAAKNLATINLDLGLQFWPYYGPNAGVGLIAEGYGGMMPFGGFNVGYQYDFGAQAFAGLPNFKIAGKYLMGDRGGSRSEVFSSGAGKTTYDAEGATKFTRLMVGPRFTFDAGTHPNHHLELFYIMEQYSNMTNIKSTGVNLTYSSDNRLKIYCDYMFNAARIGQINYELEGDVKNTGTLVTFGIVRTFDRFGQR